MKNIPQWVLDQRKRGFDAFGRPLKRPSKAQKIKPLRARGLSGDQLTTIYHAQNGRCANENCHLPIKIVGRTRAMDVATGKMLCKACSLALGIMARSKHRILGLVSFLEKHNG